MFRYEEVLGELIVSQILLLLGFSSDGQQFNKKHVKREMVFSQVTNVGQRKRSLSLLPVPNF